MTIHNGNAGGVNHDIGTAVLSGRGLPRRKANRDQRIAWAADYHDGRLWLKPSINQASAIFNVPVARVAAAVKARASNDNGGISDAAAHLINVWAATPAADREAAIRTIGEDIVFDALTGAIG